MKKFLLVLTVFVVGVYLFGCGKKDMSQEDPMGQLSMETLSTTGVAAPEAKTSEALSKPQSAQEGQLEPLPPVGPYKPTGIEIQTALKNASFYEGPIDGKVGPVTKKAIEEFQKANGLTADGKVGPKTWEALSKYLLAPGAEKKKRR